MAATAYPLTVSDWADCGAADDCTLQIPNEIGVCVIFTTAAAKPNVAVKDGLRLSAAEGEARSATIQKAGLKLWARGSGSSVTVTVER